MTDTPQLVGVTAYEYGRVVDELAKQAAEIERLRTRLDAADQTIIDRNSELLRQGLRHGLRRDDEIADLRRILVKTDICMKHEARKEWLSRDNSMAQTRACVECFKEADQ